MQTFNYNIKELFNKGLRPLEESPRNGSYLTAVSNARISEGGLIQADKLIRDFALNEDAQIFSTYKGLFILTKDTLYSYINSTLSSMLTSLTVGGMWSHADFGDYLLFTNGEVNLIRDPITGVFATDTGTVFPLAKCICAHRGRLILGGPKNYPEIGETFSNWVAWSDIGKLAFLSADDISQARQNLAGYMPMQWQGNILRLATLTDKVIVYGDNGITALPLASVDGAMSTYGKVDIHKRGIRSQGAMTTNGKEDEGNIHYFVDNVGWLYKMGSKLDVKQLGYKEFLT